MAVHLSILSALRTPTYKLEKYLVPILEPLTKNKYTEKDLFNFVLKLLNKIPATSWEA